MDRQISELGAEVQSLTQGCRQLDAGGPNAFIRPSLHWGGGSFASRSCSFALYLERALCACVCETSFSELKELNGSLTTDEMLSEIQELKAECVGHRARLEKIKSAANHVTPAEKEKVGAARVCTERVWGTLLTRCPLSPVVSFFFLTCRFTKSARCT